MITRKTISRATLAITALPAASLLMSPAAAQTSDDPLTIEAELYGGRSVVPPDIIENDVDQARLEGVLGAGAIVSYRENGTRLYARAGTEVFPTESLLNRYAFSIGGSQDVPIAQGGRIRLRLGGALDHVRGDEGRVFNRARADAQLIARHGGGHTSVARARYGYRDQSEERFSGFDQSEWLGELRHTYRPPGSESSINVAAFVQDVDAEDDRFSFSGLGLRVVGRTPLSENLNGFVRASYLNRDFEDPFSTAFPISRDDNVWRISGGVERPISRTINVFAEAGYIDHASNIPARDFSGLLGRVGLRARLR